MTTVLLNNQYDVKSIQDIVDRLTVYDNDKLRFKYDFDAIFDEYGEIRVETFDEFNQNIIMVDDKSVLDQMEALEWVKLNSAQDQHEEEIKEFRDICETIHKPSNQFRNKEHNYALWVKRGFNNKREHSIAVNYTENMQRNMKRNDKFEAMLQINPKWKEDKLGLQNAIQRAQCQQKFDFFKACHIDKEDEKIKEYLGIDEFGNFTNFNIIHLFTDTDFDNLTKLFFDYLIKDKLWGWKFCFVLYGVFLLNIFDISYFF